MSTSAMDGIDQGLVARLRRVSVAAGALGGAMGAVVLAGYSFGLETLQTVHASLGSMKVNTALALAALGASVLFDRARWIVAARLAAAIALTIGILTLVEHLASVNLGIDQLLVDDPDPRHGLPGRASVATSLALVCGGTASLLVDVELRGRAPSPWFAAGMLLAGLHAIAGYTYGVSALYELAPPTPTSLLAAFAVASIGLAILFARPDRGGVAILVSDTLGGYLARRLLPIVAAATLVLGWLRVLGEGAGLYGTVTGVALHAASSLAVIFVVVWASATRLGHVDLERRRTAHEMRELIESAPDGLVVQREDTIVYCSRALGTMLGRPTADLVGTRLLDLVDRADRKRLHDALGEVQPAHWERIRAQRLDGQTRLLDVARFPDVHFGGTASGLIVLRDVTDRVALESQVRAADRLATVGMLAAGVGHEINNPLMGLLFSLEMLERGNRADAREVIVDARVCASKIREIVADLRMLARPDDESREPISIEPVLETSLRIAGNQLRGRAHIIRDYGDAPLVVANEARLGQVVLNLIINAAHALPDDAPDHHFVRVGLGVDANGWAVIEVSDNGCGIDPEVAQRLFEPFFTTRTAGTGLGLSISQRIVTSLGGTIDVESRPGEGATFRVRLPPPDDRAFANGVHARGRCR